MLQDDDSLSMMLFFGFVGALNAACLAPVLVILHLAGFVNASGLTLRVFALTVCKGMPAPASACRRVINWLPRPTCSIAPHHTSSLWVISDLNEPTVWRLLHNCAVDALVMQFRMIAGAGLFDNVLSDYLWARAVLLIGKESPLPPVLHNPQCCFCIESRGH